MEINREELKFIRGNVKFDEPMSRHSSFRIGGPADVWVAPSDAEDLLRILKHARDRGIKTFILGGGSKILVGDRGVRGFVISLGSPSFRYAKFSGGISECGCGTGISEFIYGAARRGLGGCEFLAGLPGTIGGALVMNAGSPSQSIGDFVEEVYAVRGSEAISLKRGEIKFSYRSSGLEEFVLTGARIKLAEKKPAQVNAELKENLDRKKKVQDMDYPSVGCIFKNPAEGLSSARLIELSGFKGRSAGGAAVSSKHANFIINRGACGASDVMRLIDDIRKKVFKDHGIVLELEVKLVGEF